MRSAVRWPPFACRVSAPPKLAQTALRRQSVDVFPAVRMRLAKCTLYCGLSLFFSPPNLKPNSSCKAVCYSTSLVQHIVQGIIYRTNMFPSDRPASWATLLARSSESASFSLRLPRACLYNSRLTQCSLHSPFLSLPCFTCLTPGSLRESLSFSCYSVHRCACLLSSSPSPFLFLHLPRRSLQQS